MTAYYNLDLARRMMSQKSPSDLSRQASSIATGDGDRLDVADASGCLAYVNRHTPTENPNLMRSAVACYVQDDKRQSFYNEVVKLAEAGYQSKRLRKRHAKNLAKAVVIDTMRCALTDKDKACVLGISSGNYSKNHSQIFESVSGEVAGELSIADDVAGEYWRATFRGEKGA